MDTGEWLTRGTVWLALSLYVAAEMAAAFRPGVSGTLIARWVGRVVRGFFMFMIFNGAVVFARSPMRWYGLVLCALLVVCWWRVWKQTADNTRESKLA